jgi:hypothetical protein
MDMMRFSWIDIGLENWVFGIPKVLLFMSEANQALDG